MKKLNLTLLICGCLAFTFPPAYKSTSCVEDNFAFQSNEAVYYDVFYNWGFIWVNAGEVFFKVEDTVYQDQPVYLFHSYGTSLKKWDWFYKVRDTYKAYVKKETLQPLLAIRETSEGGYDVSSQSVFDYDNSTIISASSFSDKPDRYDTVNITGCTFDVLSMIYYTRNINFSVYKSGDKIPVRCIIDGEVFDLHIRYLGLENIVTREKEKYRCHKFKPLLVEGTIFTGGENMTVWVSDDLNRIPVQVEAKVLVGSIKASLKEAHHLRNPVSSLLK